MDIVPSIDEDVLIKNDIINSGVSYSNTEKTVAITNKEIYEYNWLTSNSLGFGDWFLRISNQHLTNEMKSTKYNNLPYDIRMVFASAEKIPTY